MAANGSSLLEFVLRVASFPLPVLITALIGAWYALRHRARHPRVTLLATAGFAVLVVAELASIWVLTLMSPAVPPTIGGAAAGSVLATWSFVTYLGWLAALVLLLVAAYTERGA